jgi:hypothetical protein
MSAVWRSRARCGRMPSGMGNSGGARAYNPDVDPHCFATWGRRCGAGEVTLSLGAADLQSQAHRGQCLHGPYSDRRVVAVAHDGRAYTLTRTGTAFRSGLRVLDLRGRHVQLDSSVAFGRGRRV